MKGEVSPGMTVVATEDQVSTKLGQDETTILSLDRGVYYGLNQVATRVWELVREPRTVQEVHQILSAEYDVDPKQLERDLISLLQKLAAEGLVEVTG